MTQLMFLDTGRCSDLLHFTGFLTKTLRVVLVAHPLLAAARQARLHLTRIVNLDRSGAVEESSRAILFHEKARGTVVPIVSANVS